MSLEFNAADHTYTWHGFHIPSLSEVLSTGGCGTDYSMIPESTLQFARERGQAVHRAIEARLTGRTLEWEDDEAEETFNSVCGGYMDSWELALPELPSLDGSDIEVSVGGWCGFGTTPDCVTEDAIIEWKCTSKIYPTHYVQLAGQAHALQDDLREFGPRQRIIVQLKRDGKPSIKIDRSPLLHDDVFNAAKLISEWKGRRLKP